MIERIAHFMAWLGGGDPEIMPNVSGSRTRFIQMAGVLLTTAGIAMLSMTFALHDGMKVPLILALVLGLAWGAVILNLDRFLVLSMDVGRGWNLLLMALPRLALAAVLSLVISAPMVLRIFASDISNQIRVTQLEQSAKEGTLESKSKEVQQYNHALQQIAKDKAILAGSIPATPYTPLQTDMANVSRLTLIVGQDHQAELSAYEKWQCELQGQTGAGCPGTSGRAGNGARATTDRQAYQAALATYNQGNAQLQQWLAKEKKDQAAANTLQISSLDTDRQLARKDLDTQAALASQLAPEIRNIETQDTAANRADTGILAQLRALSEASSRDPSLNAARLLVTLVFFLIEILPVTVKVLLSLAKPTAYDLAVRARDDKSVDEARRAQVEDRRLAELKSDALVSIAEAEARSRVNIAKAEAQSQEDVETDRITKKKALEKQANSRVVGEMGRIVMVTLDTWSQQVQAKVAAGTGASSANGSAAPANGTAPAANGSASSANGSGPPVSGDASPVTGMVPPANGTTPSADGTGYPADADSLDPLSPGYPLPDGDDL